MKFILPILTACLLSCAPPASAAPPVASHHDKAPFDSSQGLKDYEKLQAERFYGIVKAAREAGVHRIDVWGLSEADNQHWLVGQNPRLFDEQFQPRPAYQAVLKALYDTQQ